MSSPMHKCNNFQDCQKTVLFILMKSLNSLHTVELTQEIILQSLSTLFARLTCGKKPYHTLVPLCGTIYPKQLKKGIIETPSNIMYIKSLSKPVHWYYCHHDYLGLLLYYYYYYLQYYSTIISLTNPVPYPILNWGITIKIWCFCLFCVIPAIFHF